LAFIQSSMGELPPFRRQHVGSHFHCVQKGQRAAAYSGDARPIPPAWTLVGAGW